MSNGTTMYPSAPASRALRPAGVRSSRISAHRSRAYSGARPASGSRAAAAISLRTLERRRERGLRLPRRFASVSLLSSVGLLRATLDWFLLRPDAEVYQHA